MHINALNNIKYINKSIGWYYASKFRQWKNMYILIYMLAIYFSVFFYFPLNYYTFCVIFLSSVSLLFSDTSLAVTSNGCQVLLNNRSCDQLFTMTLLFKRGHPRGSLAWQGLLI